MSKSATTPELIHATTVCRKDMIITVNPVIMAMAVAREATVTEFRWTERANRSEASRQRIAAGDAIAVEARPASRTLIGESNFEALRLHHVEVTTVTDEEVVAAMKLLWNELKIVVEPSSATVMAAVLRRPERFHGKRLGLILTGGNVDLDALPW